MGKKCNHLEKKQYTRGEGSLWGWKIVLEIIYKPVNEAWFLGDMNFQRFSDLDLPGNWNVCIHIDFLPHLQEISKDGIWSDPPVTKVTEVNEELRLCVHGGGGARKWRLTMKHLFHLKWTGNDSKTTFALKMPYILFGGAANNWMFGLIFSVIPAGVGHNREQRVNCAWKRGSERRVLQWWTLPQHVRHPGSSFTFGYGHSLNYNI